MEELDHQTSESFEGTWYPDRWAHLDEDSFGGVDVDLKLSCLVDRRVKEGKKTLVGNIRPSITDVAIHLAHDANMFITIEQRVLLLPLGTRSVASIGGFVGFEASIGENNNQSFSIFVGGGDWDMLFCDEFWQVRRWERLGSWSLY